MGMKKMSQPFSEPKTVSFRNYAWTLYFPLEKESLDKYLAKHNQNSALPRGYFEAIVNFSQSFNVTPEREDQDSSVQGYTLNIAPEKFTIYIRSLFETIVQIKPTITFVIGQLERCPTTGRPHIQAYLKCEKLTFNTIKKVLPPTAHIEVSRSSPQANVNYVTKSKTRMSPHVYVGEPPKGAGHRTDLEAVYEMMEDLVPEDQMLAVLRQDGLRHLQLYQRGMDVMLGQAAGQERRNLAIAERREAVIARHRAFQQAAEAAEAATQLRIPPNAPPEVHLDPVVQPPPFVDTLGLFNAE